MKYRIIQSLVQIISLCCKSIMAAVNAFNQILIQSPSDIKHQALVVYLTKLHVYSETD